MVTSETETELAKRPAQIVIPNACALCSGKLLIILICIGGLLIALAILMKITPPVTTIISK